MKTTAYKPIRFHCWEGYETDLILKPFCHAGSVSVSTETLLSDYSAACNALRIQRPDILNINNAYISNYLHPKGVINPLNEDIFSPYDQWIHPDFEFLSRWAFSKDGSQRLGIAQRFGAFNLVINQDQVSISTAQREGFNLANDPSMFKKYGILLYEDFNIFHISIAAGLNPFVPLSKPEIELFRATANHWFRHAKFFTDDHFILNQALVDGEIAFYLSGGTYTASPVRLAGHHKVIAVTPSSGPINGLGGIVFTEITSVLKKHSPHPLAEKLLAHFLQPEVAKSIAFTDRTCNPVLHMGNEKLMNSFSSDQLNAIQWDTLAEDISRCVEYDLVPNHDELANILASTIVNYDNS